MGNSQKALDEQVIKAYHFIQSFAPTDEVTPEEAHQIGMDFMKKTFDDRYAFLCSTHVDKNHIHNHFVMCSASRDMSGRKLDDNLSLLHSLRKNNDILCKEHDSQLDAFHDAVFALERRNIDLDSITYEGIKIMQQKVTEAETEIKRQEDIKRQNERDLKELSDYQKEIDLYFGRMNDEI